MGHLPSVGDKISKAMPPAVMGKELNCSGACGLNLAQPVEMVLAAGQYASFDDFMAAYFGTLDAHFTRAADGGAVANGLVLAADGVGCADDLPATDAAAVTENGKPLTKAEGVKYLRTESDRVVLALGSGSYHFQVE